MTVDGYFAAKEGEALGLYLAIDSVCGLASACCF